jgi:RNA polymerase sigma-B factor
MSAVSAPASTRAPVDVTALDETALLARYHRFDDRRAREELVKRYVPAARKLARKYARSHESIDDLAQAAVVGLIRAVDRFDLAFDNSFAAFAFPTMLGELKRYLRNTRWGVHMPRGMQERTIEVRRATARLTAELNRVPRPHEIAHELGLTVEEVVDALQAHGARDPVSLERPRHDDDEDGDLFIEAVGDTDEHFDRVDDRSAVAAALKVLPERERRIVELRFGEDLTQSEIGERIGVSQMQVSRLLRRAIGRMRIVAGGEATTIEEAGARAKV